MSTSKVYLVGAGPGDRELITLKGMRLISDADVIVYDHLIPLELLDSAKEGAEIISAGKFAGKHTLVQDKINELLVEKAKQNKNVVRLKGGDPYLFGRGGEEAEACIEAGVDFEVVPGVTSALAAASYAGIPPTHRDCTSNLAIVTGHKKDDSEIEIPKAGTVIFLMSVGNIARIVASLLKAGWSKDTRIAAVEHGTFYDQRVVKGKLDDFLEIAEKAKLRTPAIFIVGRVVEMQEKLDWFTKKPNVLLLGNHPHRYGYLGNIIHRRIIDCVAIDDYTKTDTTLKDIAKFDWIVLTSVNGAKFLFERLYKMGLDARSLTGAKIAVIGKTTAKRLRDYGIVPDMIPTTESSAGLLDEFKKLGMAGKKILLPQSEIASRELPEGLKAINATIEEAPVYKTIEIDPGQIDFDYIDKIMFTSGSTVKAFMNKFKDFPPNTEALALGIPTQKTAQQHGIKAKIPTPQ